jgi:potassium efflux system protein
MNAYSRNRLSFLAALLLGVAGSLPAPALSANAVGSSSGKAEEGLTLPSTQDLETRIADLEKLEVTDDVHKLELSLLRELRLALRNTQDAEARITQFLQLMEQAPAELRRIERELAAPLPEPTVAEDQVDALAQQLAEARQALDSALQERTLVRTEESTRLSRNQKIPVELSEARKRITEILAAQSATASPDVPSVISATKRLALSAELAYQQQRAKTLDTELLSYVARQDLLRARIQLAERHVLIAQRDVESLEKRFNALQTLQAEEVQRTAEAGRVATGAAHPALRLVAEQNAAMAQELAVISANSQSLATRKQVVDEQLQTLQNSFLSIKARIEQVGLTNAIGLHLRGQLLQLPDSAKLQRRVNGREGEMNAVQMRRTELDDELLRLVDLQGEARARLAAEPQPVDLPEEKRRNIEQAIVEALADQKKNYLNTLISAYDLYFSSSLMPLHDSEQRLLEITREYDKFIAEKILWIQSDQPLSAPHLLQSFGGIQWLLSPDNWLLAAEQVKRGVIAQPMLPGGLAALVAALFLLQPRLRRKLNGYGTIAHSATQTALMPSILATAVTLVIAAPLPVLLWSISLILPHPGETGFSGALAAGFSRVAVLLYAAELWRIVCRRNGLAEAHFKWSRNNLERVRFHLRWFVPVILPLAFVIAATNAQPVDEYRESLGRLAFILAMLAEAVFIQRLLLPGAGVFSNWLQKNGAGWIARLKYLWFPAAVAAPLGLALAAALGYFYTALQLEQRLLATIWMLLAVLVLHALLIHWLHREHRRLAIEKYQKKHEIQSKGEAAAAESEIPASLQVGVDLDEDELQNLSTQALKFVNALIVFTIALGLILVWQDVFPAFGMLREVELWSVVIPAAGDAASQTLPITLADISTAILILVVTGVVSSNIPGLLEMAVLQHLPFTPSSRYAVTTIVRYLIVILGVVWAFGAIGIGWSKVQFLAAAITVGLGFGLQEIFANFVSGLIMLFERQVRVGDAVTIGQTSGIVSRIRMRATTITDWNLKELIIPNKEFVTGQVINWSLSDPKLRLDLPVGIAYGSDTDLAVKTLLEVAHSHKQVLKDPEAKALFIAFGDSSLNFELRVYIPGYEQIIPVRHELLTAIDKAFREQDIEIAFPQRDIHIRSADPAINALLGRTDRPAG